MPPNNELAEKLATDQRVAFLSFIGSGRVGWSLRSKVAPGTRYALEHGGSAPCIVDASANIEQIVEPLTKGGYYHAGQVCVSTQRIFAHESKFDALAQALSERVSKLRVADPSLEHTEVGPLILPKEVERVVRSERDEVSRVCRCQRQPTCERAHALTSIRQFVDWIPFAGYRTFSPVVGAAG